MAAALKDPWLGIKISQRAGPDALDQLEEPTTFSESVMRLITEQVLSQGARAELVADLLEVSTVTLHRRLRSEGFRFKELVDSRSKALTEQLLAFCQLPIAAVSRRLGFSDPATFSRAFRRWFNATLRDYRKAIQRDRLERFRSGL